MINWIDFQDTYDQTQTVQRRHEFTPDPYGRGGAEKYNTEITTKTQSRSTMDY